MEPTPTPPCIEVFVIDDHPVLRVGLRMLLGTAPDLHVAGDAPSAREALGQLAATHVDVVLLDLDLGAERGLDTIPALRTAAPGARFLVVTGLRDAHRHRESLLAGAHGLVSKEERPEILLKAIRRVHAGELWFDRALVGSAIQEVLDAARRADPGEARIASLTPRERAIAELVAEGLRNEDIAERLSVAEKTVRNHISEICDKLGVAGRLELLVFANQHGIGRLRPRPR